MHQNYKLKNKRTKESKTSVPKYGVALLFFCDKFDLAGKLGSVDSYSNPAFLLIILRGGSVYLFAQIQHHSLSTEVLLEDLSMVESY